jgi:hypothetical protein
LTFRQSQGKEISQQPQNWENRNGLDLVQAFPKKWWVESDLTVPNLPLPLRLKGSACHYNSIFNNRHLYLRNRLLDQGYKKIRLIQSLKKFIFRYQDLVENYSPLVTITAFLTILGQIRYNSSQCSAL